METHTTKTPLVDMRNISIAFGGIKAVDDVSVQLHGGAKWSGSSATMVPANRL